ncbi:MAG: M48 family metalloprotease [Phycisphaeraceae bacterium]|nr:M48 family metalloprotease [Phycisphaeraceae bacterium]
MLHVLVILMLASIALHDSLRSGSGTLAAFYDGAAGWWTVPMTLLPLAALALLALLGARAGAAMLDAGRIEGAALADRACAAARVGAVCVFAAAVLTLGWLDAVRMVIGDVILIDELVALSPALAVFCASWAGHYAIESRIRQAIIMRGLDTGATMYPVPSRARFVLTQFRHQVLLSLVPIMLLMGWAECAERIADYLAANRAVVGGALAWLGALTADRDTRPGVLLGAQLIGVALVLSLAPLALRYVWDTVRLAPGPIRARLEDMCREHNVGVRELLVWRTHGSMINGAVMGLWGRLRYILLTDALLDSLPREQVEAVMAHELGHVRHRHVPWLIAVMLATLLWLSIVASALLRLYIAAAPAPGGGVLLDAAWGLGALGLEIGSMFGILAGAVAVFMFVSRRFEWQADAFAALHLSGGKQVTPEGAGAMAGALEAVGRLNGVPLRRGSWRHGSLALRIARLRALIGRDGARLPIDSTARTIKIGAAAGLLCAAALVAASAWLGF